MDRKKRFTRYTQLGILAIVVFTLIWPITREMHILNLRLLFGISGENTVVTGQVPGGPIEPIPQVQFTDEYLAKLQANSAQSPESYILAFHTTIDNLPKPDLQSWKNHRHADWAAFEYLYELTRSIRKNDPDMVGNWQLPRGTRDDRINECKAITLFAQNVHPDNGALWIAEAALHFARGANDKALEALSVAGSKPKWHSGCAEVYTDTVEHFKGAGLYEFDANILCYNYGCISYFYAPCVVSYADAQLCSLISNAVELDDEVTVRNLCTILLQLQAAAWHRPVFRNCFHVLPSNGNVTGFVKAVAKAQGIEWPDVEKMEYEHEQAWREGLLTSYFTRVLDTETAEILMERDAEYSHTFRVDSPIQGQCYSAHKAGCVSLGLFAVAISALLLETPFKLRSKPYLDKNRESVYGRLMFLLLLLAATIFSLFLIFRATDAINQPAWFEIDRGIREGRLPFTINFTVACSASLVLILGRFAVGKFKSGGDYYAKFAKILFFTYILSTYVTSGFANWAIHIIRRDTLVEFMP